MVDEHAWLSSNPCKLNPQESNLCIENRYLLPKHCCNQRSRPATTDHLFLHFVQVRLSTRCGVPLAIHDEVVPCRASKKVSENFYFMSNTEIFYRDITSLRLGLGRTSCS